MIDIGSNSKLMPLNMFKMFLFSNTVIADLNKCIHKKVMLHTYNNSCIPQIGICKATIAYKTMRSDVVSL